MAEPKAPRVMYRKLAVCRSCWNEHEPDRPAGPFNDGPIEECIGCEQLTTSGIYVRMRVEWA